MSTNLITVNHAAEILGVSVDTIRRWEKKGLIKATRSENNYRLFDLAELQRLQQKYSSESSGRGFYVLSSPQSGFTSIELFSGAGGLALGLENAGFETKLLVEFDKDAASTLRTNRPDWNVIHDDVHNVDFTPFAGNIDLVAGGFPCQAFSYAGHGRGFDDTRGTLFFEFARCVNEVKPKIALGENVRGLLQHDSGRTLSTMVNVLEQLGYKVAYRVLRAQFHDVPQKRERLFIIGIRKDIEATHIFPKEQDYTVSLREALADCPPSVGATYPARKREIMQMVPEGGYWRDLPKELQKEYMKGSLHLGGGKTGMARRLSWDEPSLTLTCNPAQKQTERCHPAETRPLNIREYARLQTFPDSWDFSGSINSQYKQIGNAVPVNLAYHVGQCLIASLSNHFVDEVMEFSEAATVTIEPVQLPLF